MYMITNSVLDLENNFETQITNSVLDLENNFETQITNSVFIEIVYL